MTSAEGTTVLPPLPHGSLSRTALVVLLLALALTSPSPAAGESKKTGGEPAKPKEKPIPVNAGDVLAKAKEALDFGEKERAAGLFLLFYRRFPDSPKAEDCLWQAAQLYQTVATVSRQPDRESAILVYGLFITGYSSSPRIPEAYFQTALLEYQERRFRDALSRFKLLAKRFPESPYAREALYYQGKSHLASGQPDEAEKIFNILAQSGNPATVAEGQAGLAELAFLRGRNDEALELFRKSMAVSPPVYHKLPDMLLAHGRALIKSGNEEQGRRQLLYYLNLAGSPPDKTLVLAELAESHIRSGEQEAAIKYFDAVLDEGGEGEREVVLARFRRAQFFDSPEIKTKRRNMGDLKDPTGDKPYEDFLEVFFDSPIAQEARWGLLQRYRAREEFEKSMEQGKSYLRYVPPNNPGDTVKGRIDSFIRYAVEELFSRNAFKELCDFYTAQHPYVAAYPEGRVLYLVGRAMEALYLYDQAAVVYYRAMKLPLEEADRMDLYLRRARVYLAIRDLKSADILLSYLRKTFAGSPHIGEINWYSGQLSEAQGKFDEALDYYRKEADASSSPERKAQCAADVLRLLLHLKRYREAAQALAHFRQTQALPSGVLQERYLELGDVHLRGKEWKEAVDLYQQGLAAELPQVGRTAQILLLHLADAEQALGLNDKARETLERAKAGTDPFFKDLAEKKLRQEKLEQAATNKGLRK